MFCFDNQRQGIGGDQKIKLAAADVDIGEDGCPAAGTRQVLDELDQQLSLRCVLYGRADMKFDHSGARHSHLALDAAGCTSGEIAA